MGPMPYSLSFGIFYALGPVLGCTSAVGVGAERATMVGGALVEESPVVKGALVSTSGFG